jgi:hypothetical protein
MAEQRATAPPPPRWRPSSALTSALATLLRALARREAEVARGDRDDRRNTKPRQKPAAAK